LAAMDFNSEFLRWMLSRRCRRLSAGRCAARGDACGFRLDSLLSHAGCVSGLLGIGTPTDAKDARTWQDFQPTHKPRRRGIAHQAGREGCSNRWSNWASMERCV